MTKKTVKVLVRTRPTACFSQDQIVIDGSKGSVQVNRREGDHGDGRHGDGQLDNQRSSWSFAYDRVLHNAGQEETYRDAASEVVSGVVEGVNGTVMAYGQTGAGKTFTMTGDSENFKQRGITPRAITQLFAEVEERPQQEFSIYASYMEIYNERIFDLLDDGKGGEGKGEFQITEDPRTHSMQVRGLTLERVEDEEEALNVLFRGNQNRVVAEHQLNKQSNRSHSIFTLHVQQQSRLRSDQVLRSKLNLVDLAGSERLKKAIGDKLDPSLKKESTYINKSLSYLEQVVVALTGRARQHVPYRQTKLTNVLKDSLGGNCRTVLIACISGEAKHLEETISTLKLAQRMMRVENNATSNVQADPNLVLKRYERQIRELKQELMMHDSLANRSGISYDDLSPEECRTIALACKRFVEAGADEAEGATLAVESVRQVQECFKQLKLLVQSAEASVEARLRAEFQSRLGNSTLRSGVDSGSASGSGTAPAHSGDLVGDPDESGFGLGEAPANSRPARIEAPTGAASPGGPRGHGDETKASDAEDFAADDGPRSPVDGPAEAQDRDGGATNDGPSEPADEQAPNDVPEDRERAFVVFTAHGRGATLRNALAEASQAAKALTPALQSARRELKDVQAEMDAKERQVAEIRAEAKRGEAKTSADGEEIIDEEEFLLLRSIKDLKKRFRQLREDYDRLKISKDELLDRRDEAQSALLDAFQAWFGAAAQDREAKHAEGDILDDGEQFDRLEIERVQAQDPDSVAFFKAQKAQRERLRRSKRPAPQAKRV